MPETIKPDGLEVFENKWIIEIKIMDQHKVKKVLKISSAYGVYMMA